MNKVRKDYFFRLVLSNNARVTRSRPKGCCAAFKHAQEAGTDNEGYGALLYELNGEWYLGYNLPPIEFCPWCGKPPST